MTKTMTHTDCYHEATKAARTKCRKERAAQAQAEEIARHGRHLEAMALLKAFKDRLGEDQGGRWMLKAAYAFTPFDQGQDATLAALAVRDYFAPSGDEAEDARRRMNGYTVTTDSADILRITLRRFS